MAPEERRLIDAWARCQALLRDKQALDALAREHEVAWRRALREHREAVAAARGAA